MKTSLRIYLFLCFCGLVVQAQNDGSSKIERNVPLVVVDSFYSFSAKDPVWFSKYQGKNNQELVYEAKFIFDDRYCKSVYDFNGIKLLLRLR
jgi:hypothetical protein